MCCGKLLRFLINIILPYSILCIFLFQIYSQYSTIVTLRTIIDNKKDGRNTITNYQLKNKHYDFNMNKVKEYFEDNAIMNLPYVKNFTLGLIEKRNFNKDKDFDNRKYMLFYLMAYDIISLIIVYCFIYGSIKAGLLKIIFQIIRFYFNAKRLKRFNTNMDLFSIINSKIQNMYFIRGWSIFNPEGFLIIEFLCNFTIILDIILLTIYILRAYKYRKNKQFNIIEDIGNDSGEEENEEKDEKDKKSDNNKIKENNEDESNEESKSNNNNIIENNKERVGRIEMDFENEDECNEVSEESDKRNNNINNNVIKQDTQDE